MGAPTHCCRWPDGAFELSAHKHQHAVSLCLGSAALVRLHGVLQDLLRRLLHVGCEPRLQFRLASLLPLRTSGVGVAFLDLLEETADAAASQEDSCLGLSR